MKFKAPRINTKERKASKAADEAAERIEVFEIDGTSYTMPADLPPAVALRYLQNILDFGRDYATAQLYRETIGVEGLAALAGCDEVSKDEMIAIVDIIVAHALGRADPGKDSSDEQPS